MSALARRAANIWVIWHPVALSDELKDLPKRSALWVRIWFCFATLAEEPVYSPYIVVTAEPALEYGLVSERGFVAAITAGCMTLMEKFWKFPASRLPARIRIACTIPLIRRWNTKEWYSLIWDRAIRNPLSPSTIHLNLPDYEIVRASPICCRAIGCKIKKTKWIPFTFHFFIPL